MTRSCFYALVLSITVAAGAGAGCLPVSPQPSGGDVKKPVVLDDTGKSIVAMERAGYRSLSEACIEISRDTRNGLITSPADQQRYFDQAVSQIREQKTKALAETMQRATRVNGKWDSEASAAAFDGLAQGYGELSK